jgi:hypothetical protein
MAGIAGEMKYNGGGAVKGSSFSYLKNSLKSD